MSPLLHVCIGCSEPKPESEFSYELVRGKRYKRARCKDCERARKASAIKEARKHQAESSQGQ